MYLNYDILAGKIKLSQFLTLSRFCPNTLILLWCGNDKGGMVVKGRASSREANIRDSAAVPILVTAIHCMPVASTAMGVDATGLWRRLAGSIRKTMSGWCRTYLYHVIWYHQDRRKKMTRRHLGSRMFMILEQDEDQTTKRQWKGSSPEVLLSLDFGFNYITSLWKQMKKK